MDIKLVDEVIKVTNSEAYDLVKLIALKERIIVGRSSGVALYGAIT